MKPVVAIIAPGSMGSAVAKRLVEHGIDVMTPLEGRSEASKARAREAGMVAIAEEQAAAADIVLSIVPPAEALPLAEKLAPLLAGGTNKPVFVDCNAVNPETVTRIAAVVTRAGLPFVDAGIVGGHPHRRRPDRHSMHQGPTHRVLPCSATTGSMSALSMARSVPPRRSRCLTPVSPRVLPRWAS